MSFAPGQIVGTRYRMVEEIASGGMGSVYRVIRIRDEAPFAFKVIRRDLSPGRETIERFKREARLLQEVGHGGVVQMIDAGLLEDGSAFLVMELLEGETLLDFLRRESPVTASELVPIVNGIARALDAVHAKGIVHRDLKPSNVFLTKDGVKLVDFGIAYATNATRLTMTGHVVGTLRYMAPEQLTGETVDSRADIYALGVIVWGAMAGGPPFVGQGMNAAGEILEGVPRLDRELPDLSKELVDAVAQATARSRNARFTSAGAFASAFERFADDAPHERPSGATGFVPLPSTRTGMTEARSAPGTIQMPEDRTTNESVRMRRRRWARGRLLAGLALMLVPFVVVALVFAIGFGDEREEAPPASSAPSVVPVPVDTPPDAGPIEPDPADAAVAVDRGIPDSTAAAPAEPVPRRRGRRSEVPSEAPTMSVRMSRAVDVLDPWGL